MTGLYPYDQLVPVVNPFMTGLYPCISGVDRFISVVCPSGLYPFRASSTLQNHSTFMENHAFSIILDVWAISPLSAQVGATSGHLRPSWADFGGYLGQLVAAGAQLGPNLGQLGSTWAQLGANLGRLGWTWGRPGADVGQLGVNLGPTWANWRTWGPLGADLG